MINSCKVIALGNQLIFAAAGDAGMVDTTPGQSWDSHTIARNLFLRLSGEKTNDPLPIRLASALGKDIKNKLQVEIRRNSAIVAGKPSGAVLTSFVFAGFEQNVPLIANGSITYTIDHGVVDTRFEPPAVSRGAKITVLGSVEIGAEFVQQSTARSKEWNVNMRRHPPFPPDQVAAYAINMVNFAITYSTLITVNGNAVADIKGLVDAVRLTPRGREWLRVKPRCPTE